MQSMCPICRHSQRSSIDESLRAGRELHTLADEFGVRTTALDSANVCCMRMSRWLFKRI
jgi:hypothetical protein